jgi:hypothetical protein
MNEKIICQKCKYYFVTWEQHRPHGCKAFNFKSRQLPSAAVMQSSGISCTLYQPKFNKV